MRLLAGVRGVVLLTWREAWRSRLWLVFVAIAVLFLLGVPRMDAVDGSARLKLSVMAVTSGTGFAVTLLAVLLGAAGLRRDLESKTAYTLFAKPIPIAGYLLGRWTGTLAWLLVGSTALAVVGVATVALQGRGLPTMRRAVAPLAWRQLSAAGEQVEVESRKTRLRLGGLPGNGVRWQFAGVERPQPGGELEVLLRAELSPTDPEHPVEQARVEVHARWNDAGGEERDRLLELDARSPYGHEDGAQRGRVLIRSRDEGSRDLGQDYLRLRLPAEAIGADGRVAVELIRLETSADVVVDRDGSARIAKPAGGLLVNLLRGAAADLAAAGLLAACALFCAVVSNLGVTLLGGLTLFFTGNALAAVRDSLDYDNPSQPVRRLLRLLLEVIPDFGRDPVSADLAAGVAVGWDRVASAWMYFGLYAAIFLVAAWVALKRKEI